MARYIIASTAGPSGRRPWGSRLQGMGDYQRANVVIPTQSQANLPAVDGVTGGLGFDFSQIPPWALWIGAAVGAYFLLGGSRKRRAA